MGSVEYESWKMEEPRDFHANGDRGAMMMMMMSNQLWIVEQAFSWESASFFFLFLGTVWYIIESRPLVVVVKSRSEFRNSR